MNSLSLEICEPSVSTLEPSTGQRLAPAPEPAPALSQSENLSGPPPRPAWIEIDLKRLRRNFGLINEDKPAGLQVLSVVKDEAYGHGALTVAKTALGCGATFLGLSTVQEAILLRERGLACRMLLLGDRHESELPWCVAHDLTCCVSEPDCVVKLGQLAARAGKCVPVHLKVNTGMNRYGAPWTEAVALAELITSTKSLFLEGVLSHLAQSDELDKTFALLQLTRFEEALRGLGTRRLPTKIRHLCNSGGFLDLPQAHFDMVRLGILPLGVYPSAVCRRIPGIAPVMTVKARVAAIQNLLPGDCVGYGMRYTATGPARIGVLPLGYGDGFPRVRNQGFVLLHGQRAPIVGGVAMDALTVDLTNIPAAQMWDEAVLMGQQGDQEITVHELAKLKSSVSYDMLTAWRARLPRVYCA